PEVGDADDRVPRATRSTVGLHDRQIPAVERPFFIADFEQLPACQAVVAGDYGVRVARVWKVFTFDRLLGNASEWSIGNDRLNRFRLACCAVVRLPVQVATRLTREGATRNTDSPAVVVAGWVDVHNIA